MRTVTHTEHQPVYDSGFTTMLEKIKQMGFAACRDEFNLVHPAPWKAATLAGYYYASGEIDALSASL